MIKNISTYNLDLKLKNNFSLRNWLIYMVVYTGSHAPRNPGKILNFILKVPGLEIYLNFVKNPGIPSKLLEKSALS